MTRTNPKLKKKRVNKKKGKPAPKRSSIVPAALFLLLTAGLIGLLYLTVGRHFPSRNLVLTIKSPAIAQPNSRKHRDVTMKSKKEGPRQPKTNPTADRSTNLIIYRLSPDFSKLVKSSLTINRNLTDQEKAQHIITLLTRPAKDSPAALDRGTKLRSVSFEKSLLTVDLSADIRNNLINSGAQDEIMTVACLTNSLLNNFPRYNALQIFIDGKKCRTLAGHIDISRPLGYQTGIAVKNH